MEVQPAVVEPTDTPPVPKTESTVKMEFQSVVIKSELQSPKAAHPKPRPTRKRKKQGDDDKLESNSTELISPGEIVDCFIEFFFFFKTQTKLYIAQLHKCQIENFKQKSLKY